MAKFKKGDWVHVEHPDRLLYQVKYHDKSLRRVYLFSDYSFWCYELDVTLATPQEIAHHFAEEICRGA
jgi:hypothetical protein